MRLEIMISFFVSESFFRIFWRATSVLYQVAIYRRDLPLLRVLNLLRGRKSASSLRRGDLLTCYTYSREIWHGRGAHGSAWPSEISLQSVHEGGYTAQKVENFHILVKIRPAGVNPLTDFNKCYELLCDQLSCMSVSSLTWFASQFTELLLRNRASVICPIFSVHPVGKAMRWIEK